MNYSQIAYEEHEEIRIIRFNRPGVMNCVGPVTHTELVDAWNRFRIDENAKVAIITGTGEKAFCAGGDLKDPPVSSEPAELGSTQSGQKTRLSWPKPLDRHL